MGSELGCCLKIQRDVAKVSETETAFERITATTPTRLAWWRKYSDDRQEDCYPATPGRKRKEEHVIPAVICNRGNRASCSWR